MKRLLFFSLGIFPLSVFAGTGLPDKPYIYVEGQATIEKPAEQRHRYTLRLLLTILTKRKPIRRFKQRSPSS